LWHYLKESVRIITWNEDAVHRTQDDPYALAYGVFFWAVTNTLSLVALMSIFRGKFVFPSATYFATGLPIQVLSAAFVVVARLWIVHFVATQFCGGDGRFIQILRPLSLASLIELPIAVIPLAFVLAGWNSVGLGIFGFMFFIILLALTAVT